MMPWQNQYPPNSPDIHVWNVSRDVSDLRQESTRLEGRVKSLEEWKTRAERMAVYALIALLMAAQYGPEAVLKALAKVAGLSP